ncbi:MAG: phosphohydrolase [Spirochaetes bacterium GWB1_48_6]|nr:MAG: phosphohydrolase [Spirochaetes bacterium GWB1_48_6]
MIKGDDLKKALGDYIDKMPPLPTSVGKIMEICQNPATSPNDLNKVISLDPVLLAKVMKLINSAYYGNTAEITSLVRAIIMLGLNTVKNLAVSTAVLATVGKETHKASILNLEGFWLHSLCVGVTAKLLSRVRKIDPKEQESYFICGLLHDMGKLPLNNKTPESLLAAFQTADQDRIPLFQAEQKALNFTHSEAGSLIMLNWKLGDDILDVALYHHNPLEYRGQHKDLLYTVVLANYFANIMEIGFSGDRHPVKPPPEVFSRLGITWAQVEALDDQVMQEIERAKVFLKIAI